jgi:hypothetical protein
MSVLLLAGFTVEAKRKTPKAGNVNDGVYSDSEYDFSITLPESWKFKVNKKEDPIRVVMIQKNYQIPPDYIDAPDYTFVPRVVVFAGKSDMNVFAFMDSLLSESYNSEIKDEMMKEFEIFHDTFEGREEIVPRERKTITYGDAKGVYWTAKGRYVKEVSLSSSGVGGKRVYGDYGGAVVLLQKDDILVAFHVMSEWNFFEQEVLPEAVSMISTIKFEK